MFKVKGDDICPLLREPCIKGRCHFYKQVLGSDPQTGAAVNQHECVFVWFMHLQIETSKEVRQGAAATESFRNAVLERAGGAAAKASSKLGSKARAALPGTK